MLGMYQMLDLLHQFSVDLNSQRHDILANWPKVKSRFGGVFGCVCKRHVASGEGKKVRMF